MQIVAVRDVAIIVLALESIIIGVLLALLLWQVRGLARMLQDEVKPILDDARETAGTVKATTKLVSETIVTPAVQASSFVTGVRRTVSLILGLSPRSRHE
jgi:hypothetical protein